MLEVENLFNLSQDTGWQHLLVPLYQTPADNKKNIFHCYSSISREEA